MALRIRDGRKAEAEPALNVDGVVERLEAARAERDDLKDRLKELDAVLAQRPNLSYSPQDRAGRGERVAARVERERMVASRAALIVALTEAEQRYLAAGRAAVEAGFRPECDSLQDRLRLLGESLRGWMDEGDRLCRALAEEEHRTTHLRERLTREKERYGIAHAEGPTVGRPDRVAGLPGAFPALRQALVNALRDLAAARARSERPPYYPPARRVRNIVLRDADGAVLSRLPAPEGKV